MLVLSGILVIVAGFMLRFNPLLVVAVSALVTGLAAGLDLTAIVAAFGKAFNDARYISVVWIVLPVIGLLEAYGLQERARAVIGEWKSARTVADALSIVPADHVSAGADFNCGPCADCAPDSRTNGRGRRWRHR
jgi:uncharacterized membrane protein